MKRIVGVVVVALMIFGLVPYQLRATAGPIFWVQANNYSSYTGGNMWNDLSGANKHVQLYGTWYHDYASWYTGAFSGEYGDMSFESDGYGLAPLVTSANYDISMEAVFYLVQNTSDTQTVLYNGNESAGNGYGIVVKSNGINRTIQVQYMGHAPIDTGFVVSIDTPYHVVVTIDSDAQVVVYVNGVLRHSSYYGLPIIPTNNTWIGNSSLSNRGIAGSVPLARMYDRALTSSEALRLWQGNLSTSTLTATHTFTPTNTPTRTWTSTPTATATPSNTPTQTWTSTPTATATPSNTPTFTPTVTSSATSTVTPSDTSTPTVPATYTATSSATRVFMPSITPSVTLSSAQKTATSVIYRTQTAVTGATRTKVTGLTRTAVIRTQTASVARAQTQTAYARTRTAQMGRTLTAIRAKTNTVIARTRTRTRTRTATLRRILIVTMTPTPIVTVTR